MSLSSLGCQSAVGFSSLLAYKAGKRGGNSPCVLNAANEVVVDAFLKNLVTFLNMPDLIDVCLEKINFVQNPSYEDLVNTDAETRVLVKNLLVKK